ncbi:MAG: AraC family transcriptional regulator ligand-binding domain-containing protein, partial [Pseudomonadota bacterium]
LTSLFVHKVLSVVDDAHDKHAVLRSIGIDPQAPVDPKVMVSEADYYRFFEQLAQLESPSVDLPLRAGASMRLDDYGAIGLAWKAAPNLLGSYERAERYARVLTSVSTYQPKVAEDELYLHLNRDGERVLGRRLSCEADLASIATISAESCSLPFRLRHVYFKHDGPGRSDVHEAFFDCPVTFSSDKDALLMSKAQVLAANKVGDPGLSSFFDAHMDGVVAQFDDEAPLDRRVRNEVSRALSQGVPKMTDIASQLGMSGRTLQRRLSDDGVSFQSLVDGARRELAERLLADYAYPLAEVAFLTGFSEQSAFNRAFKRWAGQTPRSYRLEVSASAD